MRTEIFGRIGVPIRGGLLHIVYEYYSFTASSSLDFYFMRGEVKCWCKIRLCQEPLWRKQQRYCDGFLCFIAYRYFFRQTGVRIVPMPPSQPKKVLLSWLSYVEDKPEIAGQKRLYVSQYFSYTFSTLPCVERQSLPGQSTSLREGLPFQKFPICVLYL